MVIINKGSFLMKLSTKGRYGARAALELALRYNEGPVMVKDIAESQNISERYLEHILNSLRVSGVVKSTRGAHGGYELSKSPELITLGEVIRSLEGPIEIVSCTRNNVCDRTESCVTFGIWCEVRNAVENVLDSITLADMVKRHESLRRDIMNEYII
jgi:Rrf2 family transcriptional regulator, cysteine metabolism repressor